MTREELILSAMPYVPRWIRRMIPNWRNLRYADDLVQDAYAAIVEAAGRYNPQRGAWLAYASVSVRNACVDRITWERGAVHMPRSVYNRAMNTPDERERLLCLEMPLDAPVGENMALGDVIPDSRLEGWENDVCETLDYECVLSMAELSELEQRVWRSRHEDGWSVADLAAVGIPPKVQDNAWQRTRRKLRNAYQQLGGGMMA